VGHTREGVQAEKMFFFHPLQQLLSTDDGFLIGWNALIIALALTG
jgi:hypothetical protein